MGTLVRPEPAIVFSDLSKAGIVFPGERDDRAVAGHAISVEIATPERFLTIEREWRDLTARALAANVFMEPSVVAAAAHADAVTVHVLLAWAGKEAGAAICLVGAWAFACRRPSSSLPFTVLKSPVHGHAGLGIPVLDAGHAADVLSQMLDAIADEPDLPKLIEINSLDEAGGVGPIFAAALARRGARHICLEARRRPQLIKGEAEAAPLAPSRERALRQKRRRLGKRGQVTCTEHGELAEVHAALEEFLALEIAGWKGKAIERGHAIRRMPALETFFRTAIGGLAARDLVRIKALRCDGKPVAMQITVRSGSTAFTWKSAYDEDNRDCAPGILLLQDVTAALLADPSVSAVDSCNHRDDGYMAEFWSGRRPVLDMVLDVRRGTTPAFALLGAAEMARQRLRMEARRAHGMLRSARSAVAAFRSTLPGFGAGKKAAPPQDKRAEADNIAKPGRKAAGKDSR